jgi:hypothetical protein
LTLVSCARHRRSAVSRTSRRRRRTQRAFLSRGQFAWCARYCLRCCGIYGFPGDQDVSDESNGERDRDRDHDAVVHQFSSSPMLSPPIRSSIASMPMARGIVRRVPLRLRRGDRSTGSRSRAGCLSRHRFPDGFLQRAEILLARCINAYSRGNVSRLWQRCLRWICRANAERPPATRRAATSAWRMAPTAGATMTSTGSRTCAMH